MTVTPSPLLCIRNHQDSVPSFVIRTFCPELPRDLRGPRPGSPKEVPLPLVGSLRNLLSTLDLFVTDLQVVGFDTLVGCVSEFPSIVVNPHVLHTVFFFFIETQDPKSWKFPQDFEEETRGPQLVFDFVGLRRRLDRDFGRHWVRVWDYDGKYFV